MNATNRGLNRFLLCLIGVILIGIGAAAILPTLWPAAGVTWRTLVTAGADWVRHADQISRISEATSLSWFTLALLIVLLLIIAAAGLVIARLGGGRSNVVIRDEAGEGAAGAVTVRFGFASEAIRHSLDRHDQILAVRVTAHRMRGADVLHVTVTPRQNMSPVDVAKIVTELIDNLATLVGRETPTLVSIRSGIRSRMAADQARVN